ncbi:hypothetical protein NW752_003094 [Fusarium irregulare]|uniref:Uncharacterized protein n=1 Tax=Fusarium irregulare TaxID=2494466 RepID=A0A9W8Q0F0_9HYPO|nr:hypothetical protein NW766_000762 [Fusarium irregulare]KAJ4025621.1 hypothetical protein NW752_003094 [Fusarium irregulare]
MAHSSSKAPSTEEMVSAKRHLEFSGYDPLSPKFTGPFPGLHATHFQRQQYVNAFLRWFLGDQHFDFFQVQLAQTADSDVVDRFIELKLEPSSSSAFEFMVDQVIWELHRELPQAPSSLHHPASNVISKPVCWLPRDKRPPWPWMSIQIVPQEATLSDRFSWLKSEWKGERSLRPSETRHEAAFPPRIILSAEHLESFSRISHKSESTEVEFGRFDPERHSTVIEGKVFPMAPPCPRSEDALWQIRYPTQPLPCGKAFRLEIPKQFDFWTYVWGSNGWDWAELTDNYVDDRVELGWGYQHHDLHRHEDDQSGDDSDDALWERKYVNRGILPDEDMFLMIGFRDNSWNDPRTLTPTRQDLITKLWKTINDWKQLCLRGKWTTLISFLQHMHEEDREQVSRARAEFELDGILDSIIWTKVDLHDFGNHFQEWVFSPKTLGLTVEERIYLVANVWRRRVPPEKYQLLVHIQTWVTKTRNMIRSEVYSSLR